MKRKLSRRLKDQPYCEKLIDRNPTTSERIWRFIRKAVPKNWVLKLASVILALLAMGYILIKWGITSV